MDCADRLMPAQSRQQARQYDDGNWQNTFKQGILLADAKITPYERRQLVARIDALSTEIPAQVRPLYQLWRDGQALQLQLAEERQRYSKLQQSSDSEAGYFAPATSRSTTATGTHYPQAGKPDRY